MKISIGVVFLGMRNFIITLFIGCGSFIASAQSAEQTITTQVDQFFQALESGDSALMRSLIHADIVLTTTFTHPKTGEKIFHREPASEFLRVLGTPHDSKWHEAIANIEVKIDDNLAIAWMDYSFFVDDKFSHCGVNVFELVKLGEKWVITHIIDTRRNNACNEELKAN